MEDCLTAKNKEWNAMVPSNEMVGEKKNPTRLYSNSDSKSKIAWLIKKKEQNTTIHLNEIVGWKALAKLYLNCSSATTRCW